MTGIIDVGGGMRDIYGAGVLDRCIDNGIAFDCCIGVSAGSANIASYTAGQRGRNHRFFTEYAFHDDYMGFNCFVRNGKFLNLDYVYSTLTNSDGIDPLDYETMRNYPGEIVTVATNALTGKAKYFDINDYSQDSYDVLKASSCLPIVCPPVVINGVPYFDGGLSDPVPLEKAFEHGCDKVVVILTKPLDAKPSDTRNKTAAKLLRRSYPEAAKALATMGEKYTSSIVTLREYAEKGKVLIVAPSDCQGISTLSRDRSKLDTLYHMGYEDAEKIIEFIK